MPTNRKYSSAHNYSSCDTASPECDAPRAHLAAGVGNVRAGGLNLRKQIYIGCWNVRTLMDVGSQAITMRALYDYKVDIACLSEVRLQDNGSRTVKIPGVEASYTLYHSGRSDQTGQQGVAFALSQYANDSLIAWEPISSRIALARFNGRPVNLTVIAVYAPTLPSDDVAKDEFYDALQNVVNTVPRRDMLIIAGDWNARTGPADNTTSHVIGRFGLGQRCQNGERLINFADFNRMFISSTRFQHPRKHLLTWYSNDKRTAHQIDHILIRARWASSIEDCRAYRGAETGNQGGSDHVLLRAKLRLHLARRCKRDRPKRLNITLLDNVDNQLHLAQQVDQNLVNFSNEPVSVESQWNKIKTAIQDATSTILGSTTHRRKDWVSARTLQLSALAKEARLNKSDSYRRLRREATRSARSDRNQYWSNMATTMEDAANSGNFGLLYRLIRSSSGRTQSRQTTLRNSSGEPIRNIDEKLARWMEYFGQLHQPVTSQHPTVPIQQATVYNIACGEPTKEEIMLSINHLKNKKAPGEDNIPAEIYKTCSTVLLDSLHKLFCCIWESETFPSDWSTSILLPLPKRGDKSLCQNYRGISLIDTAAKIFTSVLLRRISAERNSRTRPNQGGFRPGMGCVDQIFTLRRILEHRFKFQQPIAACFVDFKSAFDSLDRDALWNILLSDGVPSKIVNLLRSYYTQTKARVRVYGEESDEFSVDTGVRQGCPLSPVLFNFVIDWIMSHALEDYAGVQVDATTWISDLEYADDVVVLGDDYGDLQVVLQRITHFAAMVGLTVNTTKTKAFSANASDISRPLELNAELIESVDKFRYLGSIIPPNGQGKGEVINRIDQARKAFLQLKPVLWRRSEISLRTKVRVYQTAVRSVLLYGCETWPLRAEDVQKLERFDHWCLRMILKVNWRDRVSNETVRQRCCGITPLESYIRQRRLQWFGHVLRKSDMELVKKVLAPTPCEGWKGRLGGQLKTWLATIKEDVDRLGLQNVYGVRRWKKEWIDLCSDLAGDRVMWRAAIRDINGAGSSSRRR